MTRLEETIVWIPVAERLPDSDRNVLVHVPHRKFVSQGWYGPNWADKNAGHAGWTWEGVTSWAELPKGPQPSSPKYPDNGGAP